METDCINRILSIQDRSGCQRRIVSGILRSGRFLASRSAWRKRAVFSMRFRFSWTLSGALFAGILLAGVLLASADAQAQIYTCTAPDGTRVFSDKRCGADAKVVPGITNRKPPAAAKAKSAPKPATELEQLIKLCNAGDMKACTAWTLGGGPNHLREKERKAQLACEGGSLRDCEERYCKDGANEECRARVLLAARLSGGLWYLRDEDQRQPDGSATYVVRCFAKNTGETRDVTITCAAATGPDRCHGARPGQGFARLEQAASSVCAD